MNYHIQHATIINEGRIGREDIFVVDGKISFRPPQNDEQPMQPIDATGMLLIPGVIDTHVHFREPGSTEKADIASESRAAAAGGVTSFIDMPNNMPPTTTLCLLEQKEDIASKKSVVNYGFMLGATNNNIDDLLAVDVSHYGAIKLFLGSSTGNMLVDNQKTLDKLFGESRKLIVAHCEEESIIQANLKNFRMEFEGSDRETASLHPQIRTTEACYVSTFKAIERARKYGTRLHIAHISTATELNLLSNKPLQEKNVTAEVTPNHLWLDDRDYERLGNLIKCNPAIKSNDDRIALWAGLYDGLIDTIASDHAPHTLESKQKRFFEAPGGIPSVQHNLLMMLEPLHHMTDVKSYQNMLQTWGTLLVEKMCHNPALLFGIENRGFIREGYNADLVLISLNKEIHIEKKNILYKCGWSPLEGETFHNRVEMTFVNGSVVYSHSMGINDQHVAERLKFNK